MSLWVWRRPVGSHRALSQVRSAWENGSSRCGSVGPSVLGAEVRLGEEEACGEKIAPL